MARRPTTAISHREAEGGARAEGGGLLGLAGEHDEDDAQVVVGEITLLSTPMSASQTRLLRPRR